MKNIIKRTETLLDIMQYMERPILKNRFEIFYNEDNDDMNALVILSKDDESAQLLRMYAKISETPAPEEIQIIFDTPENRIAFLEGSAIDDFANSLKDFFKVLRTFKV